MKKSIVFKSERQGHGFIYENNVIERFGLTKATGYTEDFDAYLGEDAYQIKTIKLGSSIDMGDYFRNMNKSRDFYLIIGFWNGEKTNIVEEHVLYIKADKFREILAFEKAEEMKEWIKGVSNDHLYDGQWKKEVEYWKKEYGKRIIPLRFKRDHKNQKRIQCAINKKDFYDYFLKEFKV